MINKRIFHNIENKKMVIILLIVLILVVVSIGTYAWFIWSSKDNTELTLTIGELADVSFNTGDDINVSNIGPVLNYLNDGEVTNFSIRNKSEAELLTNINLNITNLPEELKEESFKYILLSSTDNIHFEEVTSGSFVDKNVGVLSLVKEEPTPLGTTYYKFIIYIDGNMGNPTDMMGKSFSGKLDVSVNEPIQLATEFVTNLYNAANKSTFTNNNIQYERAESVSLMTDIGGNIRYYGANPNNYVSFNNELWRIIGVFKDIDNGTGTKELRLKIIRNEFFSKQYAWDDNGVNEWSTATLKKYLNETYLNEIVIESRNLIENAIWNLGGYNSPSGLYANDFYTLERGTNVYPGRSTQWTGTIAILYPSDYMYAGDLATCTMDGWNWNATCRDTSWLGNSRDHQATLFQRSSNAYNVFHIYANGNVGYQIDSVQFAYFVKPTLFLKSTVQITGGDGTSENPYILGM